MRKTLSSLTGGVTSFTRTSSQHRGEQDSSEKGGVLLESKMGKNINICKLLRYFPHQLIKLESLQYVLFTHGDHSSGFPKQLIHHPHLILGVQGQGLGIMLDSPLLLAALGKQISKELVEGGGGGALELALEQLDGSDGGSLPVQQVDKQVDSRQVTSGCRSLQQ